MSGTITLTSGELLIDSDLTILGSGADVISVSGNSQSRVFEVAANTNASISGLTINQGLLSGFADGVRGVQGAGVLNSGNLSLSNSKITDNNTITSLTGLLGQGGGIFNSGTMVLSGSIVSGNSGSAGLQGQSAGGGIYNSGALTVVKSLISNNTAKFGGGIYNIGALRVENSTIYGNMVMVQPGDGGGVYGGGTFVNSTIVNNRVTSTVFTVGGGFSTGNTGGVIILNNTIVANNFGANPILLNRSIPGDISGFVTSQGNNLIGDTSYSSGYSVSDILNQPANLADLADNGGFTPTVALLPGSPAINAGNNSNAPATDQRGFARIVGGIIDIGAYELQMNTVPNPTPTPSPNPTPTPNPNCTFTLNQSSFDFPTSGGSGSFSFTASNQDCAFTVASNNPFISILSDATGRGSNGVSFTVNNNSGAARSGTITVGGQTFTVNQAGAAARRKKTLLSPVN